MQNLSIETFYNHKPTPETCETLDTVTAHCAELWESLDLLLPDSPNKTLAYRALEDVCMRSKKALIMADLENQPQRPHE